MTSLKPNALSDLWSGAGLASEHTSTAPERPFLVLPSVDHPRLVLPTRPHRAAGAILKALRDRSSLAARAQTLAVRAALVSGARVTLLPDPDLLAVAERSLPDGEYVYGVHLGPPRANRKPVLVLATRQGTVVAFVKCGVDPLTDRLVRTEAAALEVVADLTAARVPRLLGVGEHRSHPYVVQSPVSTNGPSRVDVAAVVAAQVQVAEIGRGSVDIDGALGAIVERWQQRAARLRPTTNHIDALANLAQVWVDLAQQTPMAWGSWHGDWRRTNMAVSSSKCSVWDWERFATGVPVGYDALHLFLMSRAASVRDLTSLPADLFDNAERLLRPFDVAGRQLVEVTTAGYLLELAGRYIDDDQSAAGARLGAVGDWLLPYLSTVLTHRASGHPRQGVPEL